MKCPHCNKEMTHVLKDYNMCLRTECNNLCSYTDNGENNDKNRDKSIRDTNIQEQIG
jgi:hypothetical protein